MDEDRQQWLSIAAVVLVIGGLGYFLFRQSRQPDEVSVDTADTAAEQKAQELLDSFNKEVPENASRVTLKDVSGGDSAGVATVSEAVEDEAREYSVLAALPEPESGEFYEAYLVSDEAENQILLGRLQQAKGGWMVETSSGVDLGEEAKIQVTREKVNDQTPEEPVLEGSFE